MVRKILLSLLAVFIGIQLIRPEKTVEENPNPDRDINAVHDVPVYVQDILKQKCYDCHSNFTVYPWYFNIQPIGWWMESHINDGRDELNFSSFGGYPPERAHHKLEELLEVVTDGTMPLQSYTLIHHTAKITPADAHAIKEWLTSLGVEPESH